MNQPVSYHKFSFSSTHILSRPEWSEAENAIEFGKCANVNGHGHNFDLIAAIRLSVLSETTKTGIGTFNRLVSSYIESNLDMKSLNAYLATEKQYLPTCENILLKLKSDLQEVLVKSDITLVSLELIETRNNSAKITLE